MTFARLGVALAFGALALSGSASAQPASPFRSFDVMAPRPSEEILLGSGMESPRGAYRVRRTLGLELESTFQISECVPVQPPAEVRYEMPGGAYEECRVVQVSIALECERCTPSAIVFDRVLFARYTSTVPNAQGRPAVDNWYAALSIGVRRVRLVIEEARFIVHDWSVSDPSMSICEAPIRRL